MFGKKLKKPVKGTPTFWDLKDAASAEIQKAKIMEGKARQLKAKKSMIKSQRFINTAEAERLRGKKKSKSGKGGLNYF